ncbi:pentapeptide repeat-containing protein [Lentzea sp. NPDC006480]|uniref:pentapeptide repeat-containing protein n=1 Tax=Lentzea sp. NPDC006480 TaxID=3157176 RepID=UPI0033B30875
MDKRRSFQRRRQPATTGTRDPGHRTHQHTRGHAGWRTAGVPTSDSCACRPGRAVDRAGTRGQLHGHARSRGHSRRGGLGSTASHPVPIHQVVDDRPGHRTTEPDPDPPLRRGPLLGRDPALDPVVGHARPASSAAVPDNRSPAHTTGTDQVRGPPALEGRGDRIRPRRPRPRPPGGPRAARITDKPRRPTTARTSAPDRQPGHTPRAGTGRPQHRTVGTPASTHRPPRPARQPRHPQHGPNLHTTPSRSPPRPQTGDLHGPAEPLPPPHQPTTATGNRPRPRPRPRHPGDTRPEPPATGNTPHTSPDRTSRHPQHRSSHRRLDRPIRRRQHRRRRRRRDRGQPQPIRPGHGCRPNSSSHPHPSTPHPRRARSRRARLRRTRLQRTRFRRARLRRARFRRTRLQCARLQRTRLRRARFRRARFRCLRSGISGRGRDGIHNGGIAAA